MSVKLRASGMKLDKIQLTSERVMQEVGDLCIAEIQRQTDEGRDYEGAKFEDYSPRYALQKERKYGNVFGHHGYGQVNLKATGHMLNALGVLSVTPKRVVIGFKTARANERAQYHAETGAGKSRVIRDFFGVSKSFMEKATALVQKHWRW